MQKLIFLPAILLSSLSFGQTPGASQKLPDGLRLVPPYAQSLQKNDSSKTTAAQPQVGAAARESTCGHIQVVQPPANMDSRMVIPAPDLAVAMPTLKAMAACSAAEKLPAGK